MPAALLMVAKQPSTVSLIPLLVPSLLSCHTPVSEHGSVDGAGQPSCSEDVGSARPAVKVKARAAAIAVAPMPELKLGVQGGAECAVLRGLHNNGAAQQRHGSRHQQSI